MDTQTQIDRLIELAIIQRSELKQLVEQLPQLREHLNAEVEKVFDETEPQLRAELEEWTTKQTADKTAALGVALEAKIADLAKSLEVSTQARYSAIIAEREENARLAAQAEAKIAEHAASLSSAVKDIVSAELARFPRAGEIDQLRKEFAEPRGLNPRGKWQAGETYNKLDLVTINGDSYTSNADGNRTRPSRSSADWTLVAARGTGGGGGPTSLSELTTVPSDGDVLIGSGTSWVTSNLTAGAGISITVGPGAITISATDGDITLDDGTAASPSLHFTNDPDTGIYRPAANTLGISTSGVQRMYVDANGITTVGAGGTFDGSVHAANGNANNPSFSFSSDQDTGFFRHAANEIGIALGGTQYATLTSTTFSITPVVTMASSLRVNGTTDSSSKDTGAIVTEGGLGVEKSATFGGNLTVSGTGTSSVAGSLLVSGGSVANLIGLRSTSTSGYAESAFYDAANNKVGAIGFGNSATAAPYTNAVYINTLYNTVPIVFAPNGTAALTLSGTGNTTLAGNLTVSGGTIGTAASTNLTLNGGSSGASLVLGQGTNGTFTFTLPSISSGNTTWVSAGAVGIGIDFKRATAAATLGVTLASLNGYNGATRAAIFEFNGDGATDSGRFDWWVKPTAGSLTQAMVLKSNGNLLIGTTVDSSALLQVGTNTTTAAGGMKFGTDVSVYRSGTRELTFLAASTPTFVFAGTAVGSTTTIKLGDGTNNDQGVIESFGGSLVFKRNATTALTLDSSQRAQFAGTTDSSSSTTGALTVAGGVGIAKKLYVGDNIISTGSNAALFFNSRTGANSNYAWYSPDGTVARLYDNTNAKTLVDFAANTGNATFAGTITTAAPTSGTAKAWKLGEVATVSPTSPNRTIRVEIDGTVYYISAKTTND